MKTARNLNNVKFKTLLYALLSLACFWCGCKTKTNTSGNIEVAYEIFRDSSSFDRDQNELLIDVFNSFGTNNSFDIIITSYGQDPNLIHYQIRDTILSCNIYSIHSDKLSIVMNKKIVSNDHLDFDFDGYFQVHTLKANWQLYSKRISFYKKGIVYSTIIYENVKYSNSELPTFKETDKQISLLLKIEKFFD